MADDRMPSADRVPTLTEVVELDLRATPGATPAAEGGRDTTALEAGEPPALPAQGEPPMQDVAESSTPLADASATPAVPDDTLPAGPVAERVAGMDAAGAAPPTSDPDDDAAPSEPERRASGEDDVMAAGADFEAGPQPGVVSEAPGASLSTASSEPAAIEACLPEPEPDPELGPETEPEPEPAAGAVLPRLTSPLPSCDVDALVRQVLLELTPRVDMLLESRLREALAPALARAAEGLIRDTRSSVAAAVRDLVREAADRALERHTGR